MAETQKPETLETNTKPQETTPVTTQSGQQAQSTNSQKKELTPEQKASLKEQGEKADAALSNEYKTDKFMNVQLALVDEGETTTTNFNSDFNMKIVCFFAPKIYHTDNLYRPDQVIKIPYDKVSEIVLTDRLDNISLSGHVVINNEGNALGGVLERHNNYYFVINITEYGSYGSLKYEPYIFDIGSIENITNPFKSDKQVKIHLVDIMTSILQSHSIASFIKFETTEVTKCKSYKELFRRIINYAKRYIRINNNNVYEYKKDVLFDENMLFNGKERLNGYDADQDYSHLVTASFNKIDRNASIYEALKVFLTDCVTSIAMTDQIKEIFEEIGDVLIPFFFKEEYMDQQGQYYKLWREGLGGEIKNKKTTAEVPAQPTTTTTPTNGTTTTPTNPTTPPESGGQTDQNTPATVDDKEEEEKPAQTTEKKENVESLESAPQQTVTQTTSSTTSTNTQTNNQPKSETQESDNKASNAVDLTLPKYGGLSNTLVLRQVTMRDFFMPFYLCFSYKKDGGPFVWEDINPIDFMMTLNGSFVDDLQSLSFNAIDKKNINKRWKNVIFLDGSVESGACKSTMVFFDWFYKFFLVAFLNSSIKVGDGIVGGTNNYISNVIPDFYAFGNINNVGYAENANDKTFNNMFDEYNAYTIVLTSKDTLNESLRAMGKNLASLVLANDSYTFALKGNLLRRPNEIIRLSARDLYSGGEQQLNIFTGDSTLFLYLRQVTHIWKGTTYTNKIVASKICEQV